MSRGTRRPSRGFDFLVAGAALFGFTGIVALVAAPMAYLDIEEHQRALDEARRLPDLLRAEAGQTGLLAGTVDASVPVLHAGFVAYVRERYQHRAFRFVDGQIQPLVVRADGGARVAIVNNDYRFDDAIGEWTDRRIEESPPTATSGSVRLSGIAPGDPVVIIGRRAPARGPSDFVAETVAGVSRARYFERLEHQVSATQRMVRYALGFGALCLTIAIGLGVRVAKHLAAERARAR